MAWFPPLRSRQRQAEWMDDPAADPADLRRSLDYIRRINALLGYTRATVGHLRRFSQNWRPGETIRILDVATGSADIPRAVLRWAARRGFDVSIVAVDIHATTLKLAAQEPDPRTPSPGTPGEGRGGGFTSSIANQKSQIKNPISPHPCPPPEYREREKSGRGHLSFSPGGSLAR